MCQSQTTKSQDFQRSYSLSVPTHRLSEVRTVVIACSEIGALPRSRELEMLEPVAYLTMPGGTLQLPNEREPDEDVVRFLESLLMSASQAEFVVTCLHTRCTHFGDGMPLSHLSLVGAESEDDGHNAHKSTKQPSDEDAQFSLYHHEPAATMPQHEVVKSQLAGLKRILKASRHLSTRKLTVSGWLYETEIDWISFYDNETDLFLPLSAKVELYCE